MSAGYLYQPLPDVEGGIRLHLNEHTGGCSPAVMAAVGRVTREQVASYPAYAGATRACANALGVREDFVLLTNGLDEGILTAALAFLPRRGEPAAEAVIVNPAYGMYGPCAALAGARVVTTTPGPDLRFSVEDVRRAISPATRLVLFSNPNNPTGEWISTETVADLSRLVPAEAVVFADEAYADFAGDTFMPLIETHPNVLVGRTFAKAYGLAGMRIGCLVGMPALIQRLRAAIAPFSVNVFAAAALEAALGDRAYLEAYLDEVRQSRELVYRTCRQLGLTYWRSSANFVLVRVEDAPAVQRRLASRGVHVRDRSSAPGCDGCLRMTAGLTGHTRAAMAALEEAVCAGRE
jgi:histidinol-phosphate aminotransferase